jgi:hypothetical protein
MFVIDSRVSEASAFCRARKHGRRRPVRVYRARRDVSRRRFEMKELDEINMVSLALASCSADR